MGDFAIDLAIRYQIGAARGDRSVLSAMDIQSDEFFASFGQTINDLILRHRKDLERKRSGASSIRTGRLRIQPEDAMGGRHTGVFTAHLWFAQTVS